MKQKDEERKEFLPKQWTNAATVHPTMVSCIEVLLFNFLQRLLQSRNPFVSGLRLSFHPIQPICYLFLSPSSPFLIPSFHLKCDCFSFCAPLFSLFQVSLHFFLYSSSIAVTQCSVIPFHSILVPSPHKLIESHPLNSALFIPPISHPPSLSSSLPSILSPSLSPIICRNDEESLSREDGSLTLSILYQSFNLIPFYIPLFSLIIILITLSHWLQIETQKSFEKSHSLTLSLPHYFPFPT